MWEREALAEDYLFNKRAMKNPKKREEKWHQSRSAEKNAPSPFQNSLLKWILLGLTQNAALQLKPRSSANGYLMSLDHPVQRLAINLQHLCRSLLVTLCMLKDASYILSFNLRQR